LHDEGLVESEVMPDILQGLLVGLTAFVRAKHIQCHIPWEQPHEQENQCYCPQERGNHPQDATYNVGRHSSHALSVLAPHLLKLPKVEHRGALDRGPLLHPVPIRHGRLPVKPAVIRDLLQEYALHLMGDLSPLLDLKCLALCCKEL